MALVILVKHAEAKDVHFGIWVEPEMVNPKSDLYQQHPDWILKLNNRPEDLSRNQLVLDLYQSQSAGFCVRCTAYPAYRKSRHWLT